MLDPREGHLDAQRKCNRITDREHIGMIHRGRIGYVEKECAIWQLENPASS